MSLCLWVKQYKTRIHTEDMMTDNTEYSNNNSNSNYLPELHPPKSKSKF